MAHEVRCVSTATVDDLRDLEAKVEKDISLHGARYRWAGGRPSASAQSAESFSGVTEQRARKASGPGAKRSHRSGYGEHLQRRAGVFGRYERA